MTSTFIYRCARGGLLNGADGAPPPPAPTANIAIDGGGTSSILGLYGNLTTGQDSQVWSISWGVTGVTGPVFSGSDLGGSWAAGDPGNNTSIDPGTIDLAGLPLGAYLISLRAINTGGDDTATVGVYHHSDGINGEDWVDIGGSVDAPITEIVSVADAVGGEGEIEITGLSGPPGADGVVIRIMDGSTMVKQLTLGGDAVIPAVPPGTYNLQGWGFNHGNNGPATVIFADVVVT